MASFSGPKKQLMADYYDSRFKFLTSTISHKTYEYPLTRTTTGIASVFSNYSCPAISCCHPAIICCSCHKLLFLAVRKKNL